MLRVFLTCRLLRNLSVPRTGSVSPAPLTSSSPRSREFTDEAETQRWEVTHLMPPDAKPSVLSSPPGRLVSLRCKLGGQEAPSSPGHAPTACRQGPQLRARLGTGDAYMITQTAARVHGMYSAWDRPHLLILTVAPGGRCWCSHFTDRKQAQRGEGVWSRRYG